MVKIPLPYAFMRMAETFGVNVRRVRAEKGITLEALAHEVGLAYSYVGEIERGRKNPTLDVVERIALVLDIDALELLRR
ncbi:helix-turn-helix domain-containing protein [Asticcacaulis tiandongensis]|uniref:helix-turn-helix domain-containing protein n=1 Tax=Asticcacaulis tiandongensis TaxID=2565365 RepID=UPI001FEA9733|nr:helix-turn-helix transcriptional regulator [Asticcacaulis tiandongensis]